MQKLLNSLQAAFPKLQFTTGKSFCWSPETKEVFYNPNTRNDQGCWSLLHETGHALLEHSNYEQDLELLKIEMAAWDKAKEIAQRFSITIDEEHIQDCLDTYRDWLYARSICPTCTTKCLQQHIKEYYRCHNCHTTWKVTSNRFVRPYRSVTKDRATPVFYQTLNKLGISRY